MTEPIRAILFDFDGVLVHSEPLHLRAFVEILRPHDFDLNESDYFHLLLGFRDEEGLRNLFAHHNRALSDALLGELMADKSRMMMELINGGRCGNLPGANLVIDGLRRHYPMAICSGALREEIEVLLTPMQLRDAFTTIVAAEDVAVGKPDPRGYLQAMATLTTAHNIALTPANCLVVEDSPRVIERVKAAGFRTLAIASSYAEADLALADWCIPSLNPVDLKQAIPSLQLDA